VTHRGPCQPPPCWDPVKASPTSRSKPHQCLRSSLTKAPSPPRCPAASSDLPQGHLRPSQRPARLRVAPEPPLRPPELPHRPGESSALSPGCSCVWTGAERGDTGRVSGADAAGMPLRRTQAGQLGQRGASAAGRPQRPPHPPLARHKHRLEARAPRCRDDICILGAVICCK